MLNRLILVFDALLKTMFDARSSEAVDVRVKRCPRMEMPLFYPVSRCQARASGHGRSCTAALVFVLSQRQSLDRDCTKYGKGHHVVWQDPLGPLDVPCGDFI